MEMSSKMQKNPSIRFKGFTDAWEQRKLIEEADFFDEKRIPIDSEKRVQGRYPYYGATGVIDYVDNYIFDGEYILLAEDGANIITRNSPVAYITEGKFWLNNHAHIMKMKLGSNLFLLQLLERQNYEKFNSGTAQPKLNGQIVKNMIFNFPSYKEQNKIGNFFKLIDEAIALHQRQLDNYKALKKAILQKIFNQELRFKDEKGNEYPKWMRKTVNDIGDVVTGTTPSTKEKAYYNNGIYPWVTPTDIIQKNIDSTPRKLTEQGLSKGRMLPENTILVTCIASIGKNAILKQKGSCNQQINAIVCNKNHNYEFVYYLMEKNTDVLKSLAGKGTMDIVNKDVFSKMQVTVPCLEEQLRIGKFLSELDGKIEDEHKIVNLMKKEKQGLMQQMFV